MVKTVRHLTQRLEQTPRKGRRRPEAYYRQPLSRTELGRVEFLGQDDSMPVQVDFDLVGPIGKIQTIASGRTIRGLADYVGAMGGAGGEN